MNNASILIVDDEPQILKLLASFLRRGAYQTLEARSGESALTQLKAIGGNVAAVIVDIHMPGMSGFEVAAAIRSDYPTVPILLTCSHEPAQEGQGPPAGCHFLQKPFRFREVIDRLNRVIRGVR